MLLACREVQVSASRLPYLPLITVSFQALPLSHAREEKKMAWLFQHPETVLPALVKETTEESDIVETEYTGCAWCGDGDGNGMCADCQAAMLAQSAERHASRGGR